MGRELQKKKDKSSIPKVKQKPKNKRLNIKSNPIVAANWSKSLTLSQNYHRLGLTSKLNARAGGVEPSTPLPSYDSRPKKSDSLSIVNPKATTLIPETVKIVRDPDTGAIIQVLHDGVVDTEPSKKRKPLNDSLSSDDEALLSQHDLRPLYPSTEKKERHEGIISELEKQVMAGETKKRPRKQSTREEAWIERLIKKYGDDVNGMVRDRKLNPMQQSEGDLRKRVRRWKEIRKGREGD
ncbi:MAG: hypothetical protein LQ342_001963 [Letrouitia transgressa]|nr:MAG: hypothetical protein LQ342_001963 [Letrouitia transgressa]